MNLRSIIVVSKLLVKGFCFNKFEMSKNVVLDPGSNDIDTGERNHDFVEEKSIGGIRYPH